MSDIVILQEMIQDKAKILLKDDPHSKRKNVILTEPRSSPPYTFTIYGMPDEDEVIIIKADEFESPNKIFNGDKGECKRADFVIIANTKTEKVILYIEMKAGGIKSKEVEQQLKGARCFIYYIQQIGKIFWNREDFLYGYQHRFISIMKISISKKKPRPEKADKKKLHKTKKHDTPENMKKINGRKDHDFDELI